MKKQILDILDTLNIEYTNYEHEPVFTCDEAKWVDIPGKRVKTLLLRNKKPTQYYMVVIEDYKKLDSNNLRKTLWENKLSFASEERMVEKIWVRPGHVSPFANINDEDRNIIVLFDRALKWEVVWFHPGQNDNTVVLNNDGVEKFLEEIRVEYRYFEL